MVPEDMESAINLIVSQECKIAEMSSEICKLKEQNSHLVKQLFGSKSERDIGKDVPFLPGMEEVDSSVKPAEEPAEETPVECPKKKKRNGGGWGKDYDRLPREEKKVALPDALHYDENGNKLPLKFIGYESIERLAYRNPWFIQVYLLEKWVLSSEDGRSEVFIAPHPEGYFPDAGKKTKFEPSAISHIIFSKMNAHLPLYRQEQIAKIEGLSLDRSTLCRLFMQTASMGSPLHKLMNEEMNEREINHGDETHVKMQDPGKGKCKTVQVLCRVAGTGPPLIIYDFLPGRGKKDIEPYFIDYTGTLISDAYNGYEDLLKKNPYLEHAACWAHARRKFIDAQNNFSERADEMLMIIRQIYMVERRVKKNITEIGKESSFFKMRQKMRKKVSAKLVDDYFIRCKKILEESAPGESIYTAANYSLKLESKLRHFLKDARVDIDNNPAENAIRQIALGRKNWLFFGNEEGGRNYAILLSFAETCKKNGVNFKEWLEDFIANFMSTPESEYKKFLPWIWKENQASAMASQ